MRMQIGDCCAPCEMDSVTLKGFSKSDGTEVWQHRLDSPAISTDGYIYGYAFEETDSAAAKACTIIDLYNLFGGEPLRVAYDSNVRRFKKWIRKIGMNGSVIGDSTFYWYTGNGSFSDDSLFALPTLDGFFGFSQDLYLVNVAGGILRFTGNSETGANAGEAFISWDDNNTTTTRRYTIVAAAVRNLLTVPSGGTKLRFIAENDGTNAEQTIDVLNMIGKSAADIATDLEAFPHIVSATGTGGPYPFANIDLEIVWTQSTTHFKTAYRLSATSRGYMNWFRNWDTAAITDPIATPGGGSVSTQWCLTEDDDVIGWNSSPTTGIAIPGTSAFESGTYFEKYVSGTRVWRVAPTLDRAPIWGLSSGQTKVFYRAPSIRGGRMIVGHDIARGNGQASGDHTEWQEIDLTTGSLIGTGGKNDRWGFRPVWASDDQLFYAGGDNGVFTSAGASVQSPSEAYRPDFCGLTGTIVQNADNLAFDYACPYGNAPNVADTEALYSCYIVPLVRSSDFYNYRSSNQMVLYSSDQKIATMLRVYLEGNTSRVSPDGFFGLQNYYRLQYQLMSPANAYWIEAGMEWRVSFFSATPTNTSTPTKSTAWLAFDATKTDMENALVTLLGNNTAGPNAFVSTEIHPITADDVCPQMIWQRGVTITLITETTSTPWNILDRDSHVWLRIQIRAAAVDTFFRSTQYINRIDWATGNVIWQRYFGRSSYGGSNSFGLNGILTDDLYIVAGNEVQADCYSVYQWQETGYGYGTEAWVLVADYCPTGRTPAPPEGVGEFVGQYKNGTCVR